MLSVNVIHIEELALSGAQFVADEEAWVIRMMHPLLTQPHTHVQREPHDLVAGVLVTDPVLELH